MYEHIPCDLVELLNSSVNGKLNDFTIELNYFDGTGEGFSADIIFVALTEKKSPNKISIAVKQPKGSKGKPYDYTHSLFENEVHFYKTIWPTLRQFYEEGSGKSIDIVPHCFAVTTGNNKMLGIENLLWNGFVLYDKTNPFDDEHITNIFKTYGIYHGISMALKHLDVEKYNELLRPLNPLWKTAFGNDTFSGKRLIKLSGICKKLFDNNFHEPLIRKLQDYEENGPNIINDCLSQKESVGVILHGDCWSNNFMFKYGESGKVERVKFLDFQMVGSGSPVQDLLYFFYSGASGQAYNKLDNYLQIYHSALTLTLNQFGLTADEIYSFKKLKEEWKKYSKFGYAIGIVLWHIKLADKTAISEFADTESEEKDEYYLLKISEELQEDFNKIAKELILHMYNNNFL